MPVFVDANIRGRTVPEHIAGRGNGSSLCTFGVTVEIENEDRPALFGEFLLMWLKPKGNAV